MYDTTIADRLRAEGLRVVECDGWTSRGDGNLDPGGFVFHHTAGGANGTAPSLEGVIYGFANSAPGPLANLLQSREPDGDDIFYVVAAGKANHAGTGGWNGLEGNHRVYGLEIEHTGVEHFPEHRAVLACRAAAALLRGITDGADACQHFEWSNWGDGSKIDVAQDVDANHWRAMVNDYLAGTGATPAPDTTFNREVLEMYGCYLPWINWVDVYYHGVQVESYENAGPHNVFGIGPALSSLMESGVHVTTVDEQAYTRPGGVRDQLLAGSRAALDYLSSRG